MPRLGHDVCSRCLLRTPSSSSSSSSSCCTHLNLPICDNSVVALSADEKIHKIIGKFWFLWLASVTSNMPCFFHGCGRLLTEPKNFWFFERTSFVFLGRMPYYFPANREVSVRHPTSQCNMLGWFETCTGANTSRRGTGGAFPTVWLHWNNWFRAVSCAVLQESVLGRVLDTSTGAEQHRTRHKTIERCQGKVSMWTVCPTDLT